MRFSKLLFDTVTFSFGGNRTGLACLIMLMGSKRWILFQMKVMAGDTSVESVWEMIANGAGKQD